MASGTTIATAYVQIVPSTQGISGSITEALSGESQSAGITSGKTIGSSMLSSLKSALGVASVTAAVAGVVKGLQSCVSEASDFDASMSQVAATMGTTTSEISELTDFAKEMGRTTAFSAQEAAEGLNTLAMSGLDAEQQMEVLPAVMNLASAGCLSLDSAASYVTGSIKGFGGSMEDATYYTDLMAKGATLANTDVNDLGEALSGSAATASSYGQTADSVTLSLLRLAEQNITGSEATTALNRAMADLYTPTDAAKQALSELGVACYDAEGNARDFNDITDELSVALAGYDAETQNAYKDTIFTTQGLSAFNKMTASSSDTVDAFRDALADCEGSAMQQADTQLDNLQGDVTLFKSAMSGLKTEVGEALTPALRGITQFATQGITAFTNLITGQVNWRESLHDCVDKIAEKIGITDWPGMGELINSGIGGGIANLVTEVPGKISEFVQTIDQKIKDFDWYAAGYNLATKIINGVVSIVTDIPGKIAEITSNIVTFLNNVDWQQVGYDVMMAVLNGLKMIIVDIPQAIWEVTQAIWDKITEVNWLELGGDILRGIIKGFTEVIPNALKSVGDFCSGALNAVKDFFKIGSPSVVMAEQGGYIVDGLVEGMSDMPDAVSGTLEATVGVVDSFGGDAVSTATATGASMVSGVDSNLAGMPEAVNAQLMSTLNNVTMWSNSTLSSVTDTASAMISTVSDNFSQLPDVINSPLDKALSIIKTWSDTIKKLALETAEIFVSNIKSGLSILVDTINSPLTTALSNAKTWSSDMKTLATDTAKTFVSNIQSGLSTLASTINSILSSVLADVKSWESEMKTAATDTAKAFVSNFKSGLSDFSDTVDTLLSKVLSKVTSWSKDMASAATSAGKDFVSNVVDGMSNLSDKVSGMLSDAVSTANSFQDGMSESGVALGKNLVNGMINGINDRSGALYDTISGVVSSAVSAANKAAGVSSPSKKMAWTGRMMDEGLALGLTEYSGKVDSAMDDVMSIIDMSSGSMDYLNSGVRSSGVGSRGREINITQNIYSQAQTAAQLMRECRHQAQRAVMQGV